MVEARRYPNARTLAEHFEVHVRTIHRDLECMRDLMGAPLAYHPGRRGYYYTAPYNLSLPRLTREEFLAVAAAAQLLSAYEGTPFPKQLQRALEKIRALVPDYVTVDPGGSGFPVSFAVENLRGDAERVAHAFDRLEQAIHGAQTIEMTYYTASRDEITRRRFDPYHLHYSGGAWYAIGWCHLRRDVRTFALDRMADIIVTQDRFDRLPAFDPRQHLARALRLEVGDPVAISVRFDAHQARYMRGRTWHPSQTVEELPDGGLLLRLRVGGLGEVQRWILQYGPHAEVLEPPELRQAVESALANALQNYRTGAPVD